ncbi:MAG: hypothetical protein JO314_11380 [Acidobacteria bacterium]|nr:hypothetical protein [Acidobacteriota bacterium]
MKHLSHPRDEAVERSEAIRHEANRVMNDADKAIETSREVVLQLKRSIARTEQQIVLARSYLHSDRWRGGGE